MLFNPKSSFDLKKADDYYQKVRNGENPFEIKVKKPQRSLSQNAYAHVLFGYFASEFGLTLESVKYDIFKKKCNPELFISQRTNKRGEVVEYIRSSRDLDTGEFARALDKFRNWSAAEAGLYLPSPYEEEALIYAQQQIESYAEYI